MKLRANFSIERNTDNWILISDNAIVYNTMSITNDAEGVVDVLLKSGDLKKDKILYYVDTDNRVDILDHDGIKFTGFLPAYSNFNSFIIDKF